MLFLTAILFAGDPLPPLHDLDRFPCLEACTDAIRANIARWDHARHRQLLEPHRAAFWRREIIRADQAIEAWHALLVAHGGLAEEVGGDDLPETRQEGLARLRALLGEDAYWSGRMP